MSNALFTWIAGDAFCKLPELQVFLKSLNKFNGEVVIFTHNMPEDFRKKISFKIIDIDPKEVNSIIADRFLHFYRHLVDCNYDKIILSDSKDVLFIRNPFQYVNKIWRKKYVLLFSEGMKHIQSDWNMVDQYKCQSNLKGFKTDDYRDWDVINGGFQIGTRREMANFCSLVWTNSLRSSSSDQAVINLLFRYLKEPWILVKPTEHPIVVTGEPIKEGIYSPNWKEFCVFHQWERTKEKTRIMEMMKRKCEN